MARLVKFFGLLVLCGGLGAPTRSDPCVVFLVTPSYPPLARTARITGTVDLRVYLRCTGEVEAVDLIGVRSNARPDTGNAWLSETATNNIKAWVFDPAPEGCVAARQLDVQYVFKLEGEPAYYPDTRTTLRLPHIVEVVARPPSTIVD